VALISVSASSSLSLVQILCPHLSRRHLRLLLCQLVQLRLGLVHARLLLRVSRIWQLGIVSYTRACCQVVQHRPVGRHGHAGNSTSLLRWRCPFAFVIELFQVD
jgi:hypothetical protein